MSAKTNGQNRMLSPPPDFSIKSYLEPLTKDSGTDPLSESIKQAANFGIENLTLFDLLAKVLWCTVARLFDDYLSENDGEVHLSSRNFTQITANVNELFITNEYRSDIMAAFNIKKWSDITCGQRCLGVQLVFHIYQCFVSELRNSVKIQEAEQVTLKVSNMGAEGRGKVRYIGGWVVRKLLEKSRRYVMENMNSQSKEVVEKVAKDMKKVDLLQNNVIFSIQSIRETSENPETLNVTESRQYREHGLIHISDDAYGFFMLLEQQRVDHINAGRLSQLGGNMINESIEAVTKNEDLRNSFLNLFHLDQIGDDALVAELYCEVAIRYIKMGAGQFLRDFRKDYHLEKTFAHRKSVMQKKERANRRKMKVHFTQIDQDSSKGKRVSHLRLLALVEDLKAEGLKTLYRKKELQKLCDAYNIIYLSRWNKAKLANDLFQAIVENEVIPAFQA